VDPIDALADALLTLCAESAAVLSHGPEPFAGYGGLEQWRRDSSVPDLFRRGPTAMYALNQTARETVEALPAWAAAVAALHSDPSLGPVVDQLVGTALSASQLQAPGMLEHVIEQAIHSGDAPATVDRLLTQWREEHGADPRVITTIVIVSGIAPEERVDLSPTISVRWLTDGETVRALNLGALQRMSIGVPMATVPPTPTLVVEQRLPRVVGPHSDPDFEATKAFHVELDHGITTAFASLRLLGFQHLREYARITSTGQGSTQFGIGDSRFMYGPAQPFERSSETYAKEVFAAVGSALISRPQLAIAIRRFNGSHEPRHAEDRLLDLWIAMEALFGPPDGTEVTFRLALNTANTVDMPGMTRRAVFDWAKKAYGHRSGLVHGRVGERKATRLRGGPVKDTNEISDDLREVVGAALLRFVFDSQEPDFTDLALRAENQPTEQLT
jgi:hypothetical protein